MTLPSGSVLTVDDPRTAMAVEIVARLQGPIADAPVGRVEVHWAHDKVHGQCVRSLPSEPVERWLARNGSRG